jgi:hypothetical protein
MEQLGRDRVAAVAGVLFVVAFVVGQYVAPDLVYPEEQVGGVQLTFYVNYEHALLAQAILFGVASMLLLVFVGGLRAFLARAEGQDARLAPVVLAAGAVAAGLVLLQAAIVVALTALRGNEVGVHARAASGRLGRCSIWRERSGTWSCSRLRCCWPLPRWCWFGPGCCRAGWAGWGPGSRFCSASWVSVCVPGWTLRRWIR